MSSVDSIRMSFSHMQILGDIQVLQKGFTKKVKINVFTGVVKLWEAIFSILFRIKLQSRIFSVNTSRRLNQKIAWCVDCRFLVSRRSKVYDLLSIVKFYAFGFHSSQPLKCSAACICWSIVCSVDTVTATSLKSRSFVIHLQNVPGDLLIMIVIFNESQKLWVVFLDIASAKWKEFIKNLPLRADLLVKS